MSQNKTLLRANMLTAGFGCSRGLPAGHNQAAKCRELADHLQTCLLAAVPAPQARPLQEILAAGWNTEHDVIQDDQGRSIITVHNLWTIYGLNPDGDESETKVACHGQRPQDWGHPRWKYFRYRFDLTNDDKHYINHAHCGTERTLNFAKLLDKFV